ncbi:HNH endonuclease [Mycolicibacterium sp. GCM10028919]|uniref:HNH endonuclease n=1 Tax=Mycolicibacterium sp. GCM10028919 TaxID=3273401 RepID=UPI003616D513
MEGSPGSPLDGISEDLRRIAALLGAVADDPSAEGARDELESISAELRVLITRHFGARRRAAHGQGARGAILAHLQSKTGQWVEGQELAAISGIQEWARRIRELRVESGYDIEEDGGRYRLVRAEPNADAAGKWGTANDIRRRPGSARDRILQFLIAEVGHVVTRDQLDYVAKIKEGSRRVRELRDEEGWPIESHIDVAFLTPGQYRLVSADEQDRRDPRQRKFPEELRHRVFERDAFTCQSCRRDRAIALTAGDSRYYLEVHHISAMAEQLDALPSEELNDPGNLVTLCHRCHSRETADFQRRRRSERGGQPITGQAETPVEPDD